MDITNDIKLITYQCRNYLADRTWTIKKRDQILPDFEKHQSIIIYSEKIQKKSEFLGGF